MGRYVLVFFAACAAKTTTGPSASAGKGPEAANEKILVFEGPLELDALPPHAIEVRGDTVFVWGFAEGSDATAKAEAIAKEELAKFLTAAHTEIELQFQAAGAQSPPDVSAGVLGDVSGLLGKSERAYQKLEREGEVCERVFVRYAFARKDLEAAFIKRMGKDELVKRAIASFDPDR